jgi:hypothetical protein
MIQQIFNLILGVAVAVIIPLGMLSLAIKYSNKTDKRGK